jgi:single-strand DNA-binding protein
MFSNVFRIGKDAVVRRTQNNDAVCTLSLCYTFGYKDKKTTQWIEGTIFGKTAEALEPYLTKGKQIYAMLDDVYNEEYEGKTRLKGRILKITLLSDNSAANSTATKEAPQRQKQMQDIEEDDVPF